MKNEKKVEFLKAGTGIGLCQCSPFFWYLQSWKTQCKWVQQEFGRCVLGVERTLGYYDGQGKLKKKKFVPLTNGWDCVTFGTKMKEQCLWGLFQVQANEMLAEAMIMLGGHKCPRQVHKGLLIRMARMLDSIAHEIKHAGESASRMEDWLWEQGKEFIYITAGVQGKTASVQVLTKAGRWKMILRYWTDEEGRVHPSWNKTMINYERAGK